jgi:Baseplate J-like protein
MTRVRYFCCDELRRTAVTGHPTLNAIEYLEVGDLVPPELDAADLARYNALPASERDQLLWQRRLTVVFVNPLTAEHIAGLSGDTISIEGGERITGIRAEVLATGTDSVTLRASVAGDFSRYTLALVRSASDDRPPPGFDPILSTIEFSFKIDCPSEFDCKPGHLCLKAPPEAPDIDYLAKDYASFRRLILDRMALLAPAWRDRSPADLGVTLVELLAYAGDHLSYQQDAVATEAYLETARRRVSVRRHATLVDYAMHEGSNARAWVHVAVSADAVVAAGDLCCFTTLEGSAPRIAPASPAEQAALAADVAWFEPVVASLDPAAPAVDIEFFADHDQMDFYTWGDDRCCLPAGATSATLLGRHEDLAPGMAVVFEEVKGPLTGDPADADPGHRHVVRLTRVDVDDIDETTDPTTAVPLVDPLDGTAITAIEWHAEDALPFPLCLSARTEDEDAPVDKVSVARGNVVLFDHGLMVTQDLGQVPPPRLLLADDGDEERCDRPPRVPVPVRFRPTLADGPPSQTGTVRKRTEVGGIPTLERVRVDVDASAAAALRYAVGDARPAIMLGSIHEGVSTAWRVVRDLLNSAGDAKEFVVETEHGGMTELRFGDGRNGARPRTDEAFAATYRVGNGTAGNVGADAIVHAVTLDGRVTSVRNPLPARGGTEPETLAQVRRRAPQAFRTQERAVTPADYQAVTMRDPAVQRAAATLRWTGSWHTVFLTVDRYDGRLMDPTLEAALTAHVDRYRMAGHDLEFDDPRFVSLELELFVCVAADHFRSDVKGRLLEVLSDRDLPDGRRGLFHPDRFSFGQPVYLSPILAAARDVPGVASAEVVVFQRQGIRALRSVDEGRLELGRLEIGRLANDPNFPEHGVLRIELGGGK